MFITTIILMFAGLQSLIDYLIKVRKKTTKAKKMAQKNATFVLHVEQLKPSIIASNKVKQLFCSEALKRMEFF